LNGAAPITNVITGLEVGGAEIILCRLLENLDLERWPTRVLSLTGRGSLAERVEAVGATVHAMGMRRTPTPADLFALDQELRRGRPAVVQTWLLHANVLAGSLARVRRVAPVCWSMHMTAAEQGTHGHANVALQRIEARLSWRVPARIASCSYRTFELMAADGYEMGRAEVVPNGFDTVALQPDPSSRAPLREELGISEAAPMAVHVARWHPMKDHRNLLDAATAVLRRVPDAVFVLCGSAVDANNDELQRLAAPLGDSVRLLGPRDDVARIFQAADLGVLSSASGEAMPLVIGEAMACGIPFVSTDCGDAAEMIGPTGRTVPTRRPDALAAAITELLLLPGPERKRLGEQARRRIESRYSMQAMVEGYEAIWDRLAGRSRTA